MDGKRRRLLLMKRTEADEILRSGFLQLDVLADYADYIRLLFDGVRKIAGVGHGKLEDWFIVREKLETANHESCASLLKSCRVAGFLGEPNGCQL
jgi:hypothetical protein